jgi:hypothetical protein
VRRAGNHDRLRPWFSRKAFDQVLRDGVLLRRRELGAGGEHHVHDVAPFRGGVIGIDDPRQIMAADAARHDSLFGGALRQIDQRRGFGFLRRRDGRRAAC